jgi:hypothetical protein
MSAKSYLIVQLCYFLCQHKQRRLAGIAFKFETALGVAQEWPVAAVR